MEVFDSVFTTSHKCNIPKIIHQIHLGQHPLSEEQIKWQKSWKQYNQNWTHVLWDDKKISRLTIQNYESLQRCKNFAEKSDILRLEILYQFGGLYIDTDFECLKNIDNLFIQNCCRDLIIFLETKDIVANGFIASTKNNQMIKKLIDNISIREKTHANKSSNIKYK